MNQTLRKYRATFILDTRGREETLDQLIEGVKREIAAVHGEVTAVEQLGVRDFATPTDRKYVSGPFIQVDFSAPADSPRHLHERLRLYPIVYRALVQAV